MPAGGAGMLTQLGAGGVVSLAAPIEKCPVAVVVVSTATTRMSPAGMPFAFTVTERPVSDPLVWTEMRPLGGTMGAGSELMLGQPGATGTTTT